MRCLIHVGTHHTGTTSLQKILSDQSNYLKNIGIIYPESIRYGNQHSLLPGSYLPNHYALEKSRSLNVDLYISKLKNEIEFKEYKLCFISSEVFTELLKDHKNYLLELFNKLETIFDEILIMYTSRDLRQRSFSAQKAQIRLSSSNPKFRTDIFNAPERFRNKLIGSKVELDKWKILKKKIIVLNMEDSESPIIMYINKIIEQLDLNAISIEKHEEHFREVIKNGNYTLNEDPYEPIIYLLLILIGLKIKDEEKYLKDFLTLDLINNFIKDFDPKFQRFIFSTTKLNVITFLENYKLSIFEENKIKEIMKISKFPFSSRTIILKLVDDFILKLILKS